MSDEKFPPVLNACLSAGAVLAGMVGYMLMPPIASQVIATAFSGPMPAPHGAAQPHGAHQHANVRRISAEEAKNLPNALYVDVRTQGEYERGHIKGAVWVPFEKVAMQASTLPKGRPLVLY